MPKVEVISKLSFDANSAAVNLDDVDILALDYDGKIKVLQAVAGEILGLKVEFAKVSGRYAELRAQIQVLKEVKSALQSAIRAEA